MQRSKSGSRRHFHSKSNPLSPVYSLQRYAGNPSQDTGESLSFLVLCLQFVPIFRRPYPVLLMALTIPEGELSSPLDMTS